MGQIGLLTLVLIMLTVYNLSMKNHVTALLLLFFCFMLPSPSAAVPHVIQAQNKTSKTYISDLIIKKQPVRFQIKQGSATNQTAVAEAFASWFQNVLTRLDPSKEEQLAPLLEFIRFGAQTQNYIPTDQQSDITFYFDNQATRSYCGRGTGGCFYVGDMRIYSKVNAEGKPLNYALVHEIGHALRMQDLYDEEFRPDNTMYGSGKQQSIMNTDHHLTCDDADAIVNALYVAAKKQNVALPDISFSSFCTAKRAFKNARQLNRNPLYIDYNDSRTVYTFCQDGTPRSIVRLSPSNPAEIYQTLQAPVDCPHIAETISPFQPPENVSYQIRDFFSHKTVTQKEVPDAKASVIYVPLPSGGFTAAFRYEHAISAMPGQVYITDEKGNLLYLLAYLHNGYNFVYNFFLNGSSTSTQGFIVVYDRKHPEKYFSFTNPKQDYACHADKEDCAKMEDILNTYTEHFIKEFALRKPFWGGFYLKTAQTYIKEASSWENLLLKFYPQLDFAGSILQKNISIYLRSAAQDKHIPHLKPLPKPASR